MTRARLFSPLLALALLAPLAAQAPSLLDRLPRVAPDGYAAALRAAQARGAAGAADARWIQLFYGSPEAQAAAEVALQRPAPGAEWAFLQFLSAYTQGQDLQMLRAALRLTQLAPNDPATELAVRTLSGQLENEGRTLLDAEPTLQRLLSEPLRDPTTPYMLGRSLLAAVHAPGIALTQPRAMALAGRLAHWQLWGPFGEWQNLGYDHVFAIERGIAPSYPADLGAGVSGPATRTPQPYEEIGQGINFPVDWADQGVDFASTYVRVATPTRVLLRLYSPASVALEINGKLVLRQDRRSRYDTAVSTGALVLQPGWNRILVKLAGEAPRDFDLMLRPAAGASAGLQDAATLPAGATLAAAPQRLPPPPTLASWGAARLARAPNDPVALWADGVRRLQDEDAEHARVDLEHASRLAPHAAVIWLDLAEAYGNLPDASQSWEASHMEQAARAALKASPRALRAYDRLGHVYASQGKPTQAAQQYAHCVGKGYADCDWSAFHLAVSQSWFSEAQTDLGHALAESGSDWPSVASGLQFYASLGIAQPLARWERVLASDPRAAGVYATYQLEHGHPHQAVALFQTAMGFDPSSAGLRRNYLVALQQAGPPAVALAAARSAVLDFPYDWRIAAAAGQIELRQNPAQGIAALRATAFNRNLLRHQADYLAGDKFWAPWYHSAAAILKSAPGATQYPNASSILVFDQMVDRINPDSSQDQYIHQIYRVLNSAGISQLGDVTTIAPGSDLITIRTIKQDGRMLLPDKIANIQDISMPGLEAGDYIEIEFVQHMPPSAVIPGSLDNSEFFVFNSSTQPYNYSDYIVLSPPGYPLLVDTERFPNPPTVRTLPDGYLAQQWLVQKTRMLVTEPNMPPEQNLVPKVWVSSQLTWDEMSDYFADHMYAVRRVTPEMAQEADKLAAGKATPIARADAIFTWVAAHIQPGPGTILSPARQYFTDRNGNRVATFLALLSAAKVPYRLVLARAVTDDSSTKIPSVYQFQYPLVHVGDAGPNSPAGWYDLNSDFAQLNYISPAFRGGLALVAGAQGAGAFTHTPTFDSTLDGMVVSVNAQVADSGDATLRLEMDFRGPAGEQVRNELANLPDSSLPQVYQQVLLGSYPNATSTSGRIENRHDKTKPLIFVIHATVPAFVTTDGDAAGANWAIEHLTGALGVLRRYAPLPFRKHPLIIPGDSYERTSVTVTLPPRFGSPAPPAAANLANNFGRFTSSFTQKGSQIVFNRLLFLKANLIQPAGYPAFRAFAQAIDAQDHLRLTGKVGQ